MHFMHRYLHEEGNMTLEKTNLEGKRALHEAAQSGQLECVEYLVKQGTDHTCKENDAHNFLGKNHME